MAFTMRWLLVALLVLGSVSAVYADRKRVAVLAVEGPNGDKVRSQLVKVIQRSHVVVSTDSWLRTAKKLNATKLNKANVKKVARKLDIDAVIVTTTRKRRGGLDVRIQLRSGTTGDTVDDLGARTSGTTFDKASVRDIKDEIVDVISTIDDDDEDQARTSKKRKAR